MGHDVIGMEQYVAEGTTPLDKCLRDVSSSDAYVLILGWRYGFLPVDATLNPGKLSITELEYKAAVTSRKTVLAFLLDPDSPWPPSAFDVFGMDGGKEILRFRSEVGAAHMSGVFRTPDNLASQVAAAVSNLRLNRQVIERALEQAAVGPTMDPFVRGDEITDSTMAAVTGMVENAGAVRSVVISLGMGNLWWSTRLYLLSALLQTLTPVRQLVFSRQDGSFAAMASVSAVRQGLCDAFPALAEFDTRQKQDATVDVEREMLRVTAAWNAGVQREERSIKVGVRPHLLTSWLGERLVKRCIVIPQDTGLTLVHVQQIVESLVPDVPVDWPQPEDPAPAPDVVRNRLMVVDRDAFALEVARQWVRAGIPRAPIR
jgi:hypothetical protein